MAAQQIGFVSSTKGEVFSRNAAGQMRRLSAGDPVFEGDVIITAAGSSAEITPLNGPVLNVAEQQTISVDGSVVSAAPDPTAGSVSLQAAATATTVIQAGAQSQDFNTQLEDEAAAAGLAGGGADGGHSFVNLLRIVEGIGGVAYDFPINPTGTPPIIEGGVVVPSGVVAPIVVATTTPTTTTPPEVPVPEVPVPEVPVPEVPVLNLPASQSPPGELEGPIVEPTEPATPVLGFAGGRVQGLGSNSLNSNVVVTDANQNVVFTATAQTFNADDNSGTRPIDWVDQTQVGPVVAGGTYTVTFYNSQDSDGVNAIIQGVALFGKTFSGADQFQLHKNTSSDSHTVIYSGPILGGTGNDTLSGGPSADTIFGGDGSDTLSGNGGNDTLVGGAGGDSLTGNDGNDTLFGDGGNDTLAGSAGDDILVGGTGDDTLSGDGGNDTLYGDEGKDTVSGGADNDILVGGADDDTLSGDGGNDTLYGGFGDDALNGNDGQDILVGGDGNDTLNGGNDADTLFGGAGNDNLSGGAGNDILVGGAGNDILDGGDSNDTLFGGAGNSTLTGGADADTFVWNVGDSGTTTVTDFKLTDGDKLNLADLLSGHEGATDLAGFVTATVGTTDVTISFTNGPTIVLTDAADQLGGATSTVEILNLLQGTNPNP